MYRVVALLSPGLIVASLCVAAGSGQAIEPSGTAVAVVQSADVDAATGRYLLSVSAPVFSGDRIRTGAGGEAQLRFRDQTKMVVGPNSLLLIDKFVFDDASTARSISINAVRGAFRF